MNNSTPYWETKSLFEMSLQEWESLCDGCAKCCLSQLQDDETEQLVFTDVACDLLDDNTCRCTDYENRSVRVPRCVTMTPDNVHEAAEFAPPSCAYRLVLQGQPLADWHHLVSGSVATVHERGKSVRHRVRFEREVDEDSLQDYIVEWPAEAS
ncbi:YcgN family cysteine cluster protein [Arenicella xantha]|uniref:UPF0260 protein DFR28_101647 n=1 Tax=Arenicella xantha TaxID=644221 RepID=A0A395JNN9_9GAMM|nr:YcgN family cysteine cluster protein [Arenicella xantha]RBP53261.1 hypothetical protein DFR28_101647 [Arenicella xantha]